jgi:hypothetical protein
MALKSLITGVKMCSLSNLTGSLSTSKKEVKKKGLALSFVQEVHVAKKLESTPWTVLSATPVVSM